MSNAILFIPDISGYTQFITRTEINHQQHIITELLELLIDANDIGLELAEVEGDALFMYKVDPVPSPEELLNMVKTMFVKFHTHLRYYDKYRVCHCGACEGATGLNLKFVIHQGEVGFLQIKDLKPKPQGREVILAHRLLKNSVDSKEYLLTTRKVQDISPENMAATLITDQVSEGKEDFGLDDVGIVEYNYAELGQLKKLIGDPQVLKHGHTSSKPITVETIIEKPPLEVFEVLINFEHRAKWTKGVDRMEYDPKEINKSGSQHLCVINGQEIVFETIPGPDIPEVWSFGEKSKAPPIGELYVYFLIYPHGDQSLFKIEAHPKPGHLLGRLLLPLVRWKFKSIFNKMIHDVKEYAEGLDEI